MSDRVMTSRRRPLSTCGASTIAIVQNMYTRSAKLNGPIGSVTKRLAILGSVVSPLVYMLQCQWLVILSFVDNHILSIEKFLETHLPPSSHVFNRLDTLVDKVEHLPRKIEDVIDQFPLLIHKIPFLNWAVVYTIKWLEFVTSTLIVWGLDHGIKEKEIRVDTHCNKQIKEQNGSSSTSSLTTTQINKVKKDSPIVHNVVPLPNLKCTYKEALEKGVNLDCAEESSKGLGKVDKENGEGQEDEDIELTEEDCGELVSTDESLLDLFDFGWQTPKRDFTMARSASYT